MYKDSVRTLQRTQSVTTRKTCQYMPYRETMATYCKKHADTQTHCVGQMQF